MIESDPSGRAPAHRLGHVLIDGVEYQLLDLGDWHAAGYTFPSGRVDSGNYVPGNVVTHSGVTYLCILENDRVPGSSNPVLFEDHEPPDGTYWEVFDPSTRFLDARRLWVPASTIYVPPAGQEILEATSSIAAAGTGVASWAKASTTPTLDTLLDLTTPNAPTIITAGKYGLTCQFDSTITGARIGETIKCQFIPNLGAGGGLEIPLTYTQAPGTATDEELLYSASIVWDFDAGAVIEASVINGTARTLDIAYRLYVNQIA
jgi:hypothetical protein